jgi:regulator of replication initiation timing
MLHDCEQRVAELQDQIDALRERTAAQIDALHLTNAELRARVVSLEQQIRSEPLQGSQSHPQQPGA